LLSLTRCYLPQALLLLEVHLEVSQGWALGQQLPQLLVRSRQLLRRGGGGAVARLVGQQVQARAPDAGQAGPRARARVQQQLLWVQGAAGGEGEGGAGGGQARTPPPAGAPRAEDAAVVQVLLNGLEGGGF
jgi:hypothetical protein